MSDDDYTPSGNPMATVRLTGSHTTIAGPGRASGPPLRFATGGMHLAKPGGGVWCGVAAAPETVWSNEGETSELCTDCGQAMAGPLTVVEGRVIR